MSDTARESRLTRAVAYVIGSDLSYGEHSRRLIFAFCISVSWLIIVAFGIYHLLVDSPVEGVIDLIASVYMFVVLAQLRTKKEGEPMSRGMAIATGALMIYFGTLGDQHAYRIVWVYTYPVLAIFLYGRREGMLYVGAVFSGWLFLLFAPSSMTGVTYEPGLAFRFIGSFTIVTVASWFSETIRVHYQAEYRRRNAQLEQDRRRLAVAESEMRKLAHQDALTGIPNRRSVLNSLEKAFGQSRHADSSLAVVLIDIDRFKRINDTYGHHAGDAVLIGVAQRIGGVIRREDTLGRYGGEEFLLVMPNLSPDDAPAVLEKIRSRVGDEPFRYGADTFDMTLSLGAAFRTRGNDPATLIGAADAAVYAAKNAGRNRVVIADDSPATTAFPACESKPGDGAASQPPDAPCTPQKQAV